MQGSNDKRSFSPGYPIQKKKKCLYRHSPTHAHPIARTHFQAQFIVPVLKQTVLTHTNSGKHWWQILHIPLPMFSTGQSNLSAASEQPTFPCTSPISHIIVLIHFKQSIFMLHLVWLYEPQWVGSPFLIQNLSIHSCNCLAYDNIWTSWLHRSSSAEYIHPQCYLQVQSEVYIHSCITAICSSTISTFLAAYLNNSSHQK